MSYALHIRRPVELDPITLEEWLEAVASDPEMEVPEGGRVRIAGVFDYGGEGLAVWAGHPRHDPDGFRCLIEYHEGQATAADPDDETVGKMRELAERLNAEVWGDEGEAY